ncbi:MAG: hypothetical protein PHX83_06895 [Acidobacteriia bacterium]|nr:hypothetical protein [Terriglobia bacterium]
MAKTGRARIDTVFKAGTRNVAGVPTSICGVVGVFERGPFTRTPVTSPEEFRRYFGDSFSNTYAIPQCIKDFFQLGGGKGMQLDVQRTCHYTNPADATTLTAVKAAVTLPTDTIAATAAIVTSTGAEPYTTIINGDDLDIDIGAGAVNVVFDASAAFRDSAPGGGWPIADQNGNTITVKIDRGGVQTCTFAGVTTALADVASQLNTQLTGCHVYESGGQVRIESDKEGLASFVEVTGGTANAVINFNVAEVQGTSVAGIDDISSVTNAELKDAIEATAGLIGAVVVTDLGATFQIATVATGAGASIQVTGGTARLKVSLDNILHNGSAAAALNTVTLTGKYEGTYAHNYVPVVTAASNGSTSYWNLAFYKSGVAQETFTNLSSDPTNARFVNTIINAAGTGSELFTAADLGLVALGYTAAQARPQRITHAAPVGGNDGLAALADADFIGDPAGHTGLYGLDTQPDLRMFTIPGRASAGIHAAINAYALYRDYTCYGLHPTPTLVQVGTTDLMVTWATANTFGTTEFAAGPAWPRVAIANPNTTVFGTGATIYVDPVMFKMAKFCYVDANHPDSTFTSAAGINQDAGTMTNVIGLEAPDTELTPGLRDRLADVNVDHINKDVGTPYYFDGGDNCKTTGDWPRQWHARAAILVKETIKKNWAWVKHSKNTTSMRQSAGRQANQYLRTTPSEAYEISTGAEDPAIPAGEPLRYCDTSDALNPIEVRRAGEFHATVGLGFCDDAKWTTITITRTTVASAS